MSTNNCLKKMLAYLLTLIVSNTIAVAGEPSQLHQSSKGGNPTAGHEPTIALHEKELGVKPGKPVDRGFVFYDGVYLEPPYVISRRGMSIFVNDTMIQPPFLKWPLPGDDPTFGKVDPELPEGISAETTKNDTVLKEYLTRKMAYLREHYPFDEARERMAEVYRNLPCVLKTESGASDMLIVTWTDGEADNVILFLGRYIEWDTPTLIEHLEKTRRHYEDRLSKGDAYFFWSRGGITTGGPAWVKDRFPKILGILRSSMSDEEKAMALQKPDAFALSADLCARLVATFSAPPELEERVAEAIRRDEKQSRERHRPDTGRE